MPFAAIKPEDVGAVYDFVGAGFKLMAPYAGHIGIGTCVLAIILLLGASGGGSEPVQAKAKPAPSAE
jgi:hypothetical protein